MKMIEKMEVKNKEYQTLRLFATLGILTVIAVLLFRVVLFGPHLEDRLRKPAEISVPVESDAENNTDNNTEIKN